MEKYNKKHVQKMLSYLFVANSRYFTLSYWENIFFLYLESDMMLYAYEVAQFIGFINLVHIDAKKLIHSVHGQHHQNHQLKLL